MAGSTAAACTEFREAGLVQATGPRAEKRESRGKRKATGPGKTLQAILKFSAFTWKEMAAVE